MINNHVNEDGFEVNSSKCYSCVVLPDNKIAVSLGMLGEDSSIVLTAMRGDNHAIALYLESNDAMALSVALLECINDAISYGKEGCIKSKSFVIEDKYVRLRKVTVSPDAEVDNHLNGTIRLKLSNISAPGKKVAVSRMIITLDPVGAIELQHDLALVIYKESLLKL
ncbi:hypothetical protein LMH73_008790 [Vibrio splendidus]|nr:hypothetical protein [Vibrio splendidus]MCC4879436.1 hypothetical protein [Vibrio splendidus]